MSIYDRCNQTADANKAAQWTAYRQETWWKDKAIWTETGPCRAVERHAYENILRSLKFEPMSRHDRYLEALEVAHEFLTELRETRTAVLIPLKQYLEKQGNTLYWRELGLRPASYVVPILSATP